MYAPTTISNKVQLSRETLGTEGGGEVDGGGRGGKRVGALTSRREKEKAGRDDNLNDRKVGCRNAPKLAITGWAEGCVAGGRQEGAAA